MPTNFVDTTQKEIVDIHMHAPLRMTSIILPGMIERYAFSLPDLIGSQRVFDIFT
jgi:short-subunit dehydrogenase